MRCWSIWRHPRCPSIESLPTSFKRKKDQFKNLAVKRAFISVQGLARAGNFKDVVRSNSSIRDLLKFRWPGVLAWLCYFYVGCFEKNLVDVVFKDEMARWLNIAFILPTGGDDLIIAIGAVPGTIRLATLLCMLENKGSYAADNGFHIGTTTLMHFLQIKGTCTYWMKWWGHWTGTRQSSWGLPWRVSKKLSVPWMSRSIASWSYNCRCLRRWRLRPSATPCGSRFARETSSQS